MKLPRRWYFIFLVLACCHKEPVVLVAPKEGERYLNDILDFMEKVSINRKQIDWTEFRKVVFEKAPSANTIAETYQAIKLALHQLNDHHSYYKSGNTVFWDETLCLWADLYPDVVTPSGIGYVRVTGFQGSLAAGKEFAQSIQKTIRSNDQPGLKGWLIDLRGNSGGNMDPMIGGVMPFLGEGILGYFIYEDTAYPFSYMRGIPYVDVPYRLINPDAKVAVLIDGADSSGEAVTIAFIGRPNTRLFGTRGTCGATTGIYGTILSDGATLGIASHWMADRSKHIFGGPIPPDEVCQSDPAAVAAAIAWLSK